ncbi:MAG: DUF3536 domain-containing protein, partial [Anaerolineaceae bacterium]
NAELGNFERISFNVGPTLFQWMAEHTPETLAMIVEQERRNYIKYGVGNGMAQAYNHTILPLARLHDKITQVRWGIADFEYRFGHKPAGMWLPETAADYETLQVLADHAIRFIILAPWQAEDQHLDVSRPYRVPLEMGKDITVFFFHQDLSMRMSFDPAISVDGDRFLLETLAPKYRISHRMSNQDQMFTIASDGELYGHHQPFRDKFLAYILEGAQRRSSLKPTYPALWLIDHRPEVSIEIREKTSWSCHHGVLRWSGECGCAPHSQWKAPLRHALDHIADAIDDHFLTALEPYMVDPWELRHAYIRVLNNQETAEALIMRVLGHRLEKGEMEKIRYLLAAQYERQRMFTSCGWFFDDFDRIEPRNNIAYAAQAVWLTQLAVGVDLSTHALKWLKKVKSWRSGLSADVVFNHHLMRARCMEQMLDLANCQ